MYRNVCCSFPLFGNIYRQILEILRTYTMCSFAGQKLTVMKEMQWNLWSSKMVVFEWHCETHSRCMSDSELWWLKMVRFKILIVSKETNRCSTRLHSQLKYWDGITMRHCKHFLNCCLPFVSFYNVLLWLKLGRAILIITPNLITPVASNKDVIAQSVRAHKYTR